MARNRKNGFQVTKMFRWLKDKKKQPRKAGDKDKSIEDDYGFRKDQSRNPTDALPEFISDYGFNNGTCMRIPADIVRPVTCVRVPTRVPINGVPAVNNDPAYHIYEEINDLHDLPLSLVDNRNLQTQNNGAFTHNANSWSSISLHNQSNRISADGRIQNRTNVNESSDVFLPKRSNVNSTEGPYMVVPIVCKTDDKSKRKDCVCDISIVSNRFTCACKCRKQFKKSESNYSEPWDSSESSCSVGFVSRKNSSHEKKSNSQTHRHDSTRSYVTSNSSEYSSSSAKSSIASRSSGPDMDGNDTCCEYDMSTSSESDVAEEYRSHLDKVHQNLILKEQVRNIIHSLSNSGNVTEDSTNTLERGSDVESVRTVSSLSGRSSQPTLSTGEVSDPDVLADRSESDDSSGYYEYSEERNGNSCSDDASQAQTSSKSESHKSHHKHKSHKTKHKKCPFEVKSSILEDTEMYLLPSSRKDSECDNVRVYRKPLLLPPQQTLIYQDPNRSKTRNGNRLLGDLIRMNYDKQHMIRV
ncbi:dentin sialophosphoprotein-like isoform X2 [Mizuhopecten yessoensis]|uniref:dentin sialophosphoprotein-like isoform X2 n=1 Tax=Mizuhopecten yessoensis TaxID=6573 RepID=UPI000B459B24|nr:dentin sialophosphoprotein-like isoform X2 [Mizuhopecten yessoensis]